MDAAGVDAPAGTHAHHLVPGGHPDADDAREILRQHGIDINQADNGGFLPPPGKPAGDMLIGHGETYGASYAQAVDRRIRAAQDRGGRDAVLDELAAIREKLLNGERFW